MRSGAFLLLAGCSKRPSSKAAASEDARRTLRYVELLSETRTPLADFFSILLKKHRPLHDIAKRATVTHICRKRLLEHKNLTADMPRMQVTAKNQRISLSGVEHVAGWNPGIHCVGHLKTMLGSGFVRHLQQDRTTRANFKIDDRDGWVPRFYFPY